MPSSLNLTAHHFYVRLDRWQGLRLHERSWEVALDGVELCSELLTRDGEVAGVGADLVELDEHGDSGGHGGDAS